MVSTSSPASCPSPAAPEKVALDPLTTTSNDGVAPLVEINPSIQRVVLRVGLASGKTLTFNVFAIDRSAETPYLASRGRF